MIFAYIVYLLGWAISELPQVPVSRRYEPSDFIYLFIYLFPWR